ncbi:MAG: hypothetical protein H6626_05370 [Pseudobdellovibrionaceae bacterium]|nr:MAG: hypothetical protein H6626_05370 [Pseudobdellovibrionaceae bacterium]
MLKKYVLLAVPMVLLGMTIFWLTSNKKRDGNMTLRVAFPYNRPVSAYEPTKIHLAPEYIFLENVYSPLVELSKENGTPIAGVAQSFEWKDGELHLQIRENLQTVDGIKITAQDVEFSLKRLLILSENTHGNFKDLICPVETLESIESACSGISVDGNTVILKSNGEKAFLLAMLSSIDFAILPKSSVDPKTLKITDYRNTSGPYYVENDNGNGMIKLLANKHHYNYSKNVPQEIELVPSGIDGAKDSITLFKENKVDFITTIDKLNPEKVIAYSKESGQTLHSTMNIRTFILTFTDKGLKKYNHRERLAIGKKMRSVFHKMYENTSGYEKTNQFFPALGDGSLADSENTEIQKIYEDSEDVAIKDLFVSIVRLGEFKQFEKPIKDAFPDVKLIEGNNAPAFTKYKNEDEMPDCFIGGPDTGFTEDISLISYSIYAGFFKMDRNQGSKWLADYMNVLDKNERLKRLKDLHLKTLKDVIIVPLVSAPYVALARKPWTIELSQIYANNPLWPVVKK